MKKILIATRNRDKFKIMTKLLESIFDNYVFHSLENLEQNIEDKVEVGDVENRAKEKATNVYENLKDNDYEFIIGIDDVIKMKDSIVENVKEYVNDILFNNYLAQGEIVYILRAYYFIDNAGKNISILTQIPFQYQPLTYEFKIEKNSYPLSHVLSPLDNNISVINMSEIDSNNYYLKYSFDKFKEAQKFFNHNI